MKGMAIIEGVLLPWGFTIDEVSVSQPVTDTRLLGYAVRTEQVHAKQTAYRVLASAAKKCPGRLTLSRPGPNFIDVTE
jgi:hypothetical protein